MAPRDGQGQYSPPLNNWNPAVDGNEADPAGWNQFRDDVSAAISQSVSADGQTLMTGPLNMGGQRIQSLAAPIGNGHALRRDQLIKGANIASASTIQIPNEGAVFEITGTTDIDQLSGSFDGRLVSLSFQDELTLKHSVNFNLPNELDITTRPGDTFVFYRISPSTWKSLYGPTALLGTGTNSDQIPTNDDLGTAAYANIVGTMAAGDIIESGSNANGYYIKFADGTLICRGSGGGFVTTNLPAGGVFRSDSETRVFPVQFWDLATSLIPVNSPIDGGGGIAWAIAAGNSLSVSQVSLFLAGATNDTTGRMSYTAIGRWKS